MSKRRTKEATIVCATCSQKAVVQYTVRKPMFCCEECRKKHINEKDRRLYHKKMREKRQKRMAEERAKKLANITPLPVITAEIARYNKEHDKSLSYGKYVMLKERGML